MIFSLRLLLLLLLDTNITFLNYWRYLLWFSCVNVANRLIRWFKNCWSTIFMWNIAKWIDIRRRWRIINFNWIWKIQLITLVLTLTLSIFWPTSYRQKVFFKTRLRWTFARDLRRLQCYYFLKFVLLMLQRTFISTHLFDDCLIWWILRKFSEI